MTKRAIIDPHHHLWDLQRNRYPWLQQRPLGPSVAGDIAKIAHDYLLDDYIADTAAFDLRKSVHVEAAWDPTDPVGETRWLQTIADRRGFPHGIVAHADLQAADVERLLASHAQFANVRGIRQMLNWHKDPALTVVPRADLMSDGSFLSGFKLLRKYGLSFDLQIYPGQMADAARLASAHPDTPIVLNHTGMPIDRDADGLDTWRRGMRLLAQADNVSVKISGLGMVDWKWTTESLCPFVLEAIDAFGVERSMFASNFPVDKIYSSFGTLYGIRRDRGELLGE